MVDLQAFWAHILKKVDLNEEELKEFSSYFQLSKIKKRQFIIQPQFVAKHRNYVLEGSFRAYVVGDEGEEHTIAFAIEDWWISDYNSFIYQKPATMFVVALEDSIILQIEFEKEVSLKKLNPKFETFFRIMAESSTAAMQRRIISNLTQSAEERYEDFLKKYPKIVQKVPQYALASYLGMTTEFLSRIRNRRVSKK
ncbi:MAG: Crp/Fnr family transcriptional regulator [Cytophagales bacterium]